MSIATEELRKALNEVNSNAQYIEANADYLLTQLRELVAASSRALGCLDDREHAWDDSFHDHAKELLAMKYELGRLAERVFTMRLDCENL